MHADVCALEIFAYTRVFARAHSPRLAHCNAHECRSDRFRDRGDFEIFISDVQQDRNGFVEQRDSIFVSSFTPVVCRHEEYPSRVLVIFVNNQYVQKQRDDRVTMVVSDLARFSFSVVCTNILRAQLMLFFKYEVCAACVMFMCYLHPHFDHHSFSKHVRVCLSQYQLTGEYAYTGKISRVHTFNKLHCSRMPRM